MCNRNPFRNGGGYRKTRRGISKQKHNEKQLKDALKKLKSMEALEAKVILLDAERSKLQEEEERKRAEEAAEKLKLEEANRMTDLITKALVEVQAQKESEIAKDW